jgi:hypothetical protein
MDENFVSLSQQLLPVCKGRWEEEGLGSKFRGSICVQVTNVLFFILSNSLFTIRGTIRRCSHGC